MKNLKLDWRVAPKRRTASDTTAAAAAAAAMLQQLISKPQYEKVMAYIQSGRDQDTGVLFCGGRPRVDPKGFFVVPTVLTGVTLAMKVWLEEIFGPVLASATFCDEAEALRIADDAEDSWAALGAAVLTSDKDRKARLARAPTGLVWVICLQCLARMRNTHTH